MEKRLSDLVDIPEVKLVIELDDADRDPEGITTSFVLTEEVAAGLEALLTRIDAGRGCGAFIKGNYGSGKSHLLSYLSLLLQQKDLPLIDRYPHIQEGTIRVTKRSLVKYPASRRLESIFLSALGHEGEVMNREKTFKALLERPTVFLIDELSEFLRSKPTPAAFYEDIRFLQFLGEFSSRNPVWVIATLQEWIEETGEIAANIFNRIKDRYPLRLNLTATHIEDIIDRRVILKKEGADGVIKEVFSELKRHYPALPLKYDLFRKTYPLHPLAVRFLSGLSPLFSQHRGVIQFVFKEARKLLDGPPDCLITPEAIFDHFEERLREIPEYSPLARIVYDYYHTHVETLFSQPAHRETALSVIKILILTEISPFEKRKSAKEIAEILLRKISTLNEAINYEFIKKGLLDPLVSHQMYLKEENNLYYIDPAVDEGIRIRGKIKGVKERFEDREIFFQQIAERISLPYLPLRVMKGGKKIKFLWQNSLREGVCLAAAPSEVKQDEIARMIEGVEKRLDGFLLFHSPFFTGKAWLTSLKEAFPASLLASILHWLPRGLSEEECRFVEDYLAKHQLLKAFPPLEEEVRREEAQFKEIITRVYFEGEILYGSGRTETNLKEIGYLPIEKLLAHLFDPPLSARHPNHYQVMPRVDYFSSHHLNSLFHAMIRHGKITVEEAERTGLTPYIKGLLEPLGIVKRRGGSLLISLDVENELVSHILNMVSQEGSLGALKQTLKKGRWGIDAERIDLLIAAMIVSGQLLPYRGEDVVELRERSQLTSGEISRVQIGKTLSPELLGYIGHGRFIWGEVEAIPTPFTQKKMWQAVLVVARSGKGLLKEVELSLERYRDYAICKRLSVDRSVLNRLSMFFNGLTALRASDAGLEATLAYLKEHPDLEGELKALEGLKIFFSEQLQLINKYHLYLTHPALKLPPDMEEGRTILLAQIDDTLQAMEGGFEAIREAWDAFFDCFSQAYQAGHEAYYQSPPFRLKTDWTASDAGKTLKRISEKVPSLVFEGDWWGIKRESDKIPDPCRADLSYELFLKPVCRCGFLLSQTLPSPPADLVQRCADGILHFLSLLKAPEHREKIESYILSLNDAGGAEMAKRITSLLDLNPKDVNLSLLLPLLTEAVLEGIAEAFKGRWTVREVDLDVFLAQVKGRRIAYKEMVDRFMDWIGDEEASILWVRDRTDQGDGWLRESLAKYGPQGERILRAVGDTAEGSEEGIKALDDLKWTPYPTEELFAFLEKEGIGTLKRRLREELFHRLWGRGARETEIAAVSDETMRDLLTALRLLNDADRHQGVKQFTEVIAPLNHILGKLRHGHLSEEAVGEEVIKRVERQFKTLLSVYEKSRDRLAGAKDIGDLKERLNGVVIIIDGLRYDLWTALKPVLSAEGWQVKETPYAISLPATTAHFRKSLGIESEGTIAGKRYALMKWAEREAGRRRVKRFLKGNEDIRFLHFNFVDTKAHSSTLDLYPLTMMIKGEFISAILPILKGLPSFTLISDHGFTDTGRLKARYTHGKGGIWETILPLVDVRL